jgi:hypothetical protein
MLHVLRSETPPLRGVLTESAYPRTYRTIARGMGHVLYARRVSERIFVGTKGRGWGAHLQ